jgi:hypothetical protein
VHVRLWPQRSLHRCAHLLPPSRRCTPHGRPLRMRRSCCAMPLHRSSKVRTANRRALGRATALCGRSAPSPAASVCPFLRSRVVASVPLSVICSCCGLSPCAVGRRHYNVNGNEVKAGSTIKWEGQTAPFRVCSAHVLLPAVCRLPAEQSELAVGRSVCALPLCLAVFGCAQTKLTWC